MWMYIMCICIENVNGFYSYLSFNVVDQGLTVEHYIDEKNEHTDYYFLIYKNDIKSCQ